MGLKQFWSKSWYLLSVPLSTKPRGRPPLLQDHGGYESNEIHESGRASDEPRRPREKNRGVRGAQTQGGEKDDVREGGEGGGETGHEGGQGFRCEGSQRLDLSDLRRGSGLRWGSRVVVLPRHYSLSYASAADENVNATGVSGAAPKG